MMTSKTDILQSMVAYIAKNEKYVAEAAIIWDNSSIMRFKFSSDPELVCCSNP